MKADSEREWIIKKTLSARTDDEIAEARKLIDQWLQQHPHDTAVRMAAEQLAMMEIWGKEQQK